MNENQLWKILKERGVNGRFEDDILYLSPQQLVYDLRPSIVAFKYELAAAFSYDAAIDALEQNDTDAMIVHCSNLENAAVVLWREIENYTTTRV